MVAARKKAPETLLEEKKKVILYMCMYIYVYMCVCIYIYVSNMMVVPYPLLRVSDSSEIDAAALVPAGTEDLSVLIFGACNTPEQRFLFLTPRVGQKANTGPETLLNAVSSSPISAWTH